MWYIECSYLFISREAEQMAESGKSLQFAPFSSFLDGGFWHQLCNNKLNVYGLDDTAKPLFASYFNGIHTHDVVQFSF